MTAAATPPWGTLGSTSTSTHTSPWPAFTAASATSSSTNCQSRIHLAQKRAQSEISVFIHSVFHTLLKRDSRNTQKNMWIKKPRRLVLYRISQTITSGKHPSPISSSLIQLYLSISFHFHPVNSTPSPYLLESIQSVVLSCQNVSNLLF